MTNKEWLDYLAHNVPDELAAWFDAERVETEERALDGDTEPENDDSRDKLEADVLHHVEDIRNKSGWTGVCANYGTVIEWLDRQAAITEREWIATECAKCGAMENERDRDFTELQAQVDELTQVAESKHISFADHILRFVNRIDEQTLANVEHQLAMYGYVKVLRCHDCKYRYGCVHLVDNGDGDMRRCDATPDGFCAWGKPRGEGDTE